jgi:uncharacterized RDD family membrane protein YckC
MRVAGSATCAGKGKFQMAQEATDRDEISRSALEAQYFVDDGRGVIGPVLGVKLKELIENRAVARTSHVNRVGTPNWTPVLESAPFNQFFPTDLPAAAPAYQFAGFWIRLAAYAVDETLCLAAFLVVKLIVVLAGAALFGFEATKEYLIAHEAVDNVIALFVVLIYQGLFVSGAWQATPGKRLCGLYVIRSDGARLTAAVAVLRYLCYFLSFLPLGAGFVMIFWMRERKALHDVICGTRVVHGRL